MAERFARDVRFVFKGDNVLGHRFVGDARRVLGTLLEDMAFNNLGVGSMMRTTPQGVRISVSKTLDAPPIVEIDVTGFTGKLKEDREYTVAYVGNGAVGSVSVIDVDAGEIVRTLTGFGNVSVMHAAPDNRYIYMLRTDGVVMRFDTLTVSALGLGFGSLAVDLYLSPDGTKFYVRGRMSGMPGGGGTYGYVVGYNTSVFEDSSSSISLYPNTLFGAQTFGGAVHPDGRLCLTVFGDGNGDTDAGIDLEGSDYRDAFEVYDPGTSTFYGGVALNAPYLASGNQHRQVVIHPDGEYAYTVRTARTADAGATIVPSVVRLGIDGGVSVAGTYYSATDLTGCAAISRDGERLYVADRTGGGNAYVLDAETLGVIDSFPCRPGTADEAFANGAIKIGPRKRTTDNDIYFLSSTDNTLWVFAPGGDEPKMEVALDASAHTFALVRTTERPRAA